MEHVLAGFLIATLQLCLSGGGKKQAFDACLPAGTNLEEVVTPAQAKFADGAPTKQLTVRDTLTRLKARCRKGKLVAGNGREIRFYRLIGCWGNPPADYEEQLAQQSKELERLKKKYVVIEIPCGPLDPRQIY